MHWLSYCEEKQVGDWEATLKDLRQETTMDFFLFVCGNYTLGSWGTLDVYVRQFQQLYTTVTGRFMNRNEAKEVYKVKPRTWPEASVLYFTYQKR